MARNSSKAPVASFCAQYCFQDDKHIISIFISPRNFTFLMLYFTCIDPHLGRLDYESLSDQARMEIFVAGVEQKAKSCLQDANGAYRDACEWAAVQCDDEGNVICIKPPSRCVNIKGTFNLDYIPPKCTYFRLSMKTATGTLETALLPQALEVFACGDNNFTGTVDFTKIPPAVEEFRISSNSFEGTCDLTKLPAGLCSLEIADNYFTGSMDLTALPAGLTDLDAGCNAFTGEIDLHKLPAALESLFIDGNSLCGKFSLINLPESLEEVLASNNAFTGEAIVFDREDLSVKLSGNKIDRVLDELGNVHELEFDILD